jgi:hypothetical protein
LCRDLLIHRQLTSSCDHLLQRHGLPGGPRSGKSAWLERGADHAACRRDQHEYGLLDPEWTPHQLRANDLGSAGTLVAQQGELWLANSEHEYGTRLVLPAPEWRNSAEFFLNHIRSSEPIDRLLGADVGLMAQEVLEAGLIAAAEGRTVSLPLPVRALNA